MELHEQVRGRLLAAGVKQENLEKAMYRIAKQDTATMADAIVKEFMATPEGRIARGEEVHFMTPEQMATADIELLKSGKVHMVESHD